METQLRRLEEEMQKKNGEELEQLLHTYHKLSAAFERADGYATKARLSVS